MSAKLWLIMVIAPAALSSVTHADDYFDDNFDDGMIDGAHWSWGGSMTESGGYLHADRESPADFIETISTYSGSYSVELDSRLNGIHWNDMFHGIAITDEQGAVGDGFDFGYSKYGKLFVGLHDDDGNGIAFYYGPSGSNSEGTWLNWSIEVAEGVATISVNGEPISWGPAVVDVPDGATIRMPGYYNDGDGGQQVGYTYSDVDNFSVVPGSPTWAESSVEAVSWGSVKARFR